MFRRRTYHFILLPLIIPSGCRPNAPRSTEGKIDMPIIILLPILETVAAAAAATLAVKATSDLYNRVFKK